MPLPQLGSTDCQAGRTTGEHLAPSFFKERLHDSMPCAHGSLPKRPPSGPPGKFLPPFPSRLYEAPSVYDLACFATPCSVSTACREV